MSITSERLIFKSSQINQARGHIRLKAPVSHLIDEEHETGLAPDGTILNEYRTENIKKIDEELEQYRIAEEKGVNEQLKVAQEGVEKAKEDANAAAFRILQEAQQKAKNETEVAKSDADQLLERAKLEIERMVKEAEMRVSEIEHEAYQRGYDAGRELGFKEGEAETRRLIDRLGTIIGRAVEVRERLITDSEKQMVDMVILISRKVIKDEIANRKEIVLNNIREALKRVHERDRVDIRVNFADLDLTTAHKDQLIKMMESLRKVNIYEDSRIERGGCIIETDIGSIDARISTQFKQIEEAVRNAEPLH